jgi:hypothetical protein
MANMHYVTPNRLRLEVNRDRRNLFWFGSPATVAGFFVHPVFGILCLGILLMIWNRTHIKLQGAEGEERALGVPVPYPGSLAELPDHYLVFNNIDVPGTEDTLLRELDFVVLARSGLFVIEVKHVRGEIRGGEKDAAWTQIKTSTHGERYENNTRNPMRQVKGAALALRRHLRSHGIEAWVNGIVVFTHPEVDLRHTPGSIPVVALPDLAGTILNHPPGRPLRDFHRILDVLKALRSGDGWQPEPGPRHISYFMRDFVTAHDRVHDTMAIDLSKLRHPGPIKLPPAVAQTVEAPRYPVVPVATSFRAPTTAVPAANEVIEITTVERRWKRILKLRPR